MDKDIMHPTNHRRERESELTGEEVFSTQITDTQPQDGEFVQAARDLLWKRKETGQPVQLRVQPLSMPLGRVRLHPFSWGLLHPEHISEKHILRSHSATFFKCKVCLDRIKHGMKIQKPHSQISHWFAQAAVFTKFIQLPTFLFCLSC